MNHVFWWEIFVTAPVTRWKENEKSDIFLFYTEKFSKLIPPAQILQ